MNSLESVDKLDLVELTAEVVAAYVSHNSIQRADMPELIGFVYAALIRLGQPLPAPKAERPVPPVSIRKSISDEHLISMEDGRRYKSLKRHLSGRGLTPEQYREKWSLPIDYPMVAPNYSKQRSDLAKAMGLGRRPAPKPAKPGRGKGAG